MFNAHFGHRYNSTHEYVDAVDGYYNLPGTGLLQAAPFTGGDGVVVRYVAGGHGASVKPASACSQAWTAWRAIGPTEGNWYPTNVYLQLIIPFHSILFYSSSMTTVGR
jgi:hypothetical protein